MTEEGREGAVVDVELGLDGADELEEVDDEEEELEVGAVGVGVDVSGDSLEGIELEEVSVVDDGGGG